MAGKAEMVRPNVPRAKRRALIAALPAFRAHHWAKRFQALGHTVKLMAPKFVAPYRLSGKRVICGVRSCNHTTSLGAGWGQGQSNVRDCKT
jgi:hypothetical protein